MEFRPPSTGVTVKTLVSVQ